MAVKVIGLVAIASVAGAGAVAVTKARQPESVPVGIVATESPDASANVSANVSANADADASEEDASEEHAGAAAETRTAPPRVRAAPVDAGSAEDEVKLVTRAQIALRDGRPAEALALCNDHARQFPKGSVTQECEVIAVDALVKTGRKDEARRRADRFKTRFPGSASIRRLDVLLGE
jgi:TolA-binding protein